MEALWRRFCDKGIGIIKMEVFFASHTLSLSVSINVLVVLLLDNLTSRTPYSIRLKGRILLSVRSLENSLLFHITFLPRSGHDLLLILSQIVL